MVEPGRRAKPQRSDGVANKLKIVAILTTHDHHDHSHSNDEVGALFYPCCLSSGLALLASSMALLFLFYLFDINSYCPHHHVRVRVMMQIERRFPAVPIIDCEFIDDQRKRQKIMARPPTPGMPCAVRFVFLV